MMLVFLQAQIYRPYLNYHVKSVSKIPVKRDDNNKFDGYISGIGNCINAEIIQFGSPFTLKGYRLYSILKFKPW